MSPAVKAQTGSIVTLRVVGGGVAWPIEEGDFLRTRTGRCYKVDSIVWGRSGPRAMVCTVLDDDAVQFGEPGVWEWYWAPRRRATPEQTAARYVARARRS